MAELIEMPKMSDTMTEGVIVAWHKKVGDVVKIDDLLAEVETDKATMELNSYFNGTLLYIGSEAGTQVPIGNLIAIIGKEGEDIKPIIANFKNRYSTATEEPAKPVETTVSTEQTSENETVTSNGERIKASPLAKAIAKEKGIELTQIHGSGEGGRIIKRDVEGVTTSPVTVSQPVETKQVVSASPTPVSTSENYTDIQLSQMRKTIARRLSESKFSAPHFYLTMAINMDTAITFRTEMNNDSKTKISFNDLIIKACAVALRKHPMVNVSWLGDKIRVNNDISIGVAVAIEDGLIVPVLHHTDRMGLETIAANVKTLAAKAKNKELQPQEFTGNTFTISNLGMYGIEQFTAIINPPDACILAVGAIQEEVIVKNGQPAVGNIMRVTMSCDHRAVDGAVGSAFLQTLKFLLENPVRMLL